jgi:KDO2-lipid IV(A) lauroyltransferase
MIKFIINLLKVFAGSRWAISNFTSLFSFIFFRILKYRYSIIRSNVLKCYPNIEDKNLKYFIKEYYIVLERYLIEIITLISLDKTQVLNKISLASNFEKYPPGGKILMASHCGNWEVNIVALPLFTNNKVIGFYKPISNKIVDTVMLQLRSKFGLELHPIEDTLRIMKKFENQDIWYIFLSDQSPLNMNGVHWQKLFGVETPWVNGAEKIALKYGYDVYYLHQKAIEGEQWYHLAVSPLWTENNRNRSIMSNYVQMVEKDIIMQPHYWLWSHKRWKRAHLR